MAVSQPALLGATQQRKRTNQPQFMFPQTAQNLAEGVQRPSNNAAQQSLFQQNDPFAQKIPGTGVAPIRGVSSVVDAVRGTQPVGEPAAFEPPVEGQQPPEALDRAFAPSGDQLKLIKPVTPLDILENPVGAAAQELSGVLVNNPFISAKGRQALREGRIPDLNDIQPAFYRFTNPIHVQALQGLLLSAGQHKTPESLDFFTNVFTAPSL